MKPLTTLFRIDGELDWETIPIGEGLTRQAGPLTSWDRTYYDTFDWRLARRGASVWFDEGPGQMHFIGPERSHRHPGLRVPRFPSTLPPGPMRRQLVALTKIRALLDVVRIRGELETWQIVDGADKTVCRLRRGVLTAGPQPIGEVLFLEGLRGYEPEYESLVSALSQVLEPVADGELGLALSAIGRRVGDYDSKLTLQLQLEQPAHEAIREILGALYQTILANESGVRRDLDSEFLHDYRVAIRRTRSMLSQLKSLFHRPEAKRLGREFNWLTKLSNPVRDLDVYLLKMADFDVDWGPNRAGYEPFRQFLIARKTEAHQRLVEGLDSERYKQLKTDWEAFLASPDAFAEAGEKPIGEVARRAIKKAYRLTRDGARAIKKKTPADRIHELRITAKKLRYLLEFFSSLYPKDDVTQVVRELKSIQDFLGDFNDFQVQRDSLTELASQGEHLPPATLMAIGGLVKHLASAQAELRAQYKSSLRPFLTEENDRHFRHLLRKRGQRS